MENAEKIIRDLANLYGIEILNEPTGHVFVNEKGIESPLRVDDLNEIFGLPTGRISEFTLGNHPDCLTIKNQQSSLVVQNCSPSVFNTVEHEEPTIYLQYSMAA